MENLLMRFRALAAALIFPLGLLAACGGGDDSGLSGGDDDDTETTVDDSSDDTTEETTDESSDDTTEETTDDSGDSSSTYPEAIHDLLVDTFVQQGLSEEQAECTVDLLEENVSFDDIASGGTPNLDDTDMADLGAQILEECDVDPSVFGG